MGYFSTSGRQIYKTCWEPKVIRATAIQHSHQVAQDSLTDDSVTLDYTERFKRRITMRTDAGEDFLLDLPKVTDLRHGDNLMLEDGRLVRIIAAKEPLMKIEGKNAHHLLRLVWHIGNRHLPAAIFPHHILIQPDHVIKHMIEQLGGTVVDVAAPFTPEGGAYGRGRTHRHEH